MDDSATVLPRAALARVVESKMRAEIAAAAGQNRPGALPRQLPASPWPETLGIADASSGPSLGCDSLERLWLAGALAEMFHLREGAQALLDGATFGDWLDGVAAAWPDGQVTFLTSGSSGHPKPCEHPVADLLTEIDALADLFADRTRIVSAVPAHHIYGFLFTALLPVRLGLPVAAFGTDELRARDLLVSFPDHWRFVRQTHPVFPPGVTGVTSTAPCPPDLIRDLVTRGLSEIVEVYGSSETAGLGFRRDPAHPYTLLPHWSFGREIEPGRWEIRHSSGRHAHPMDRLRRMGERGFTVEGRLDGMVQVGGVNIDPTAVADRLRRHPIVADAAVRLMRPDEGRRLKAFIVLLDDMSPDDGRAILSDWIQAEFSTSERPMSLTFGRQVPANAMGKGADW